MPENSKLTSTNTGKHIILVFWHLGYLTENDCFHLFLREFHNPVFLNRWIIFYYVNYHIFIIHSSVGWHHDSSCFLFAVSRATINMNKQLSLKNMWNTSQVFLCWFGWEWPPWVHLFAYLVPSCWNCLRRARGTALLEEVCHCEGALQFQEPMTFPDPFISTLCLWKRCEFSDAALVSCLSVYLLPRCPPWSC